MSDKNSTIMEETVIPPEQREEILNELRLVLWKWNTVKHLIVKPFNCIKVYKKTMDQSQYFIREINILLTRI